MMNKPLSQQLLVAATVAFGLLLLAMPNTAHAQATATGGTDIDIQLPETVILHYFSNVDVTIDSNALLSWLGYASNVIDEGTASGTGTTVDLAMAATNPNALTAYDLTLSNAWAVRSLHTDAGGDTQVEISITDATLDNAGGTTITINSGGVQANGGGFAVTAQFASPGLETPQYGDVRLSLDLSNATMSGSYNDGEFTLEATNI